MFSGFENIKRLLERGGNSEAKGVLEGAESDDY
jgi:hypothetical protein